MRAHVESCAPLEGCGLLAGNGHRVRQVLPIFNKARSPVRFQMEPAEQLRAFQWIESKGLELLGIFHSHPAGPEQLSPTDVTEASYPVVHLVWSKPGGGTWSVLAFWIENGQASNVQLEIAGEKPA